MADLTALPHNLDAAKGTCQGIIETPRGHSSKIDYDPESNLFCLSGVLAAGLKFPYDFGFIPRTLGDDGDPLDVLVLMDEPSHVGCLLDLRIIGAIEGEQTENGKTFRNDRLLAVAHHSYTHSHIQRIDDINPTLLDQLDEFFLTYNKERGKKFKVLKRSGPKRALAIMQAGIVAYKKKKK